MAVRVRGRATTRVVGAAVVGLAVVGALGACGAGRPGAAAVVDGRTIPTSDLNVVLKELTPYFNGASTANVLTVLVQEQTVIELASEKGVGVSEADGEDLLHQLATQADPKADVHFSPASVEVARYSTALQNLQGLSDAQAVGDELNKRLAALHVTVNPRFGTVATDNSVNEPKPLPWLVSSKAGSGSTATPTPEQTPAATPEPTPSS